MLALAGQGGEVRQRVEGHVDLARRAAELEAAHLRREVVVDRAGLHEVDEGAAHVDRGQDRVGLELLAGFEDDAGRAPAPGADVGDRRFRADLHAIRPRCTGDRVRDAARAALRDAPGAEGAVDLAHVVVEEHVRRARALDALERADDPRRRHRRLERVRLEPLAQEVVGRHRHELDEDRLLALGQLLEAPEQAAEREQRARVDRGRVGRHDREDRLDEPGHVDHERPVFLVRLGVHLRPAPELADRSAVVVDPPQVVARADRVAVAVLRRGPAHALGDRRERAVERQDVQAVARQVQLADDLRPEQRDDVREDREAEAREELLGDRRAPEHVALLQHDRLQPARARDRRH